MTGRILPAAAAAAILIGFGLAHGRWTDRWGRSDELARAAARLDRVPRVLGEWEGTDAELDPRALRAARIDGCVSRRYVNRRTGEVASVLLACGPPGPLSAHTPELCYPGEGFELAGVPSRVRLDAGPGAEPAVFWECRFCRPGVGDASFLRVFWAWSADGAWQAPDYPRVTFAASRALYKLYVIREMTDVGESIEDDPCAELIRRMVTELAEDLFDGR